MIATHLRPTSSVQFKRPATTHVVATATVIHVATLAEETKVALARAIIAKIGPPTRDSVVEWIIQQSVEDGPINWKAVLEQLRKKEIADRIHDEQSKKKQQQQQQQQQSKS